MMTLEQIPRVFRPNPLKFKLWDTPHCTIETNRTCNVRCRSCYNLSRDLVKPLADVREEIDIGLQKRNLGVITLLGGEPTLHPHLPEIVAYVKSRKITCQLLTNGLVLLQDDTNELLESLKASGVDRILVHMDDGQGYIHSDLEAGREKLFSKLEKRKIAFSLSLTIYNESQGRIPSLIKKYSRFRYFDGILAVLARDPRPPKVQYADLGEEYKSISRELQVEPLTYIPSNLDDADVRWLIYFYFINSVSGKALTLSPALYRIFNKLYRWLKRRQPYVIRIDPRLAWWVCLFAGVAECVLRPQKIVSLARLLSRSNLGRAVRFHYLAIQTPPEFDSERNQYRLCYHCPDATIRNGMLTPVCIADLINPIGRNGDPIDRVRYRAAYGHLEEI